MATPDEAGGHTLAELLDATVGVDDQRALALLRTGEFELHGRMPWSSNQTLLVSLTDGTDRVQAVYKPERGERPLADFPPGLWRREIAMYELARSLGWPLIPPTVRRDDGPAGVGSVQLFIPADYEEHYFTLMERRAHDDDLRRLCALDYVANNTDRKAGHVLVDESDRIWGIDNGLSFHAQFKLRTVIWDFAAEPLTDDIAAALAGLLDAELSDELSDLLDTLETDALRTRAGALLSHAVLPSDPTGWQVPWPMI